jgi:hypothetical protein
MKTPDVKLPIVCIVAVCLVAVGPAFARVLFNIDVFEDWEKALNPPPEPDQPFVRPLLPDEWDEYMQLWEDPTNIIEGEPYPETTFVPPVLEVYPGGGSWEDSNYPEDAGLVMYWGPPEPPEEGDYASAWVYEYGADPDLSRALIKVQVYAPQLSPFGLPGQITQISLGIQDRNYQRQAWYWNVGPGKTIQWNTWTPITVNPSIAGVNATTPKADSFAGSPAFDVKQVTIMIFDENGRWVPGSINVPPPGQTAPWHLWNYWNYLMVVPNPNPTPTQPPQPVPQFTGKYHIKWSQPPMVIDSNVPQKILGWDEKSNYKNPPIMADDWLCKDDRPVTDIHWWGSFLGWNQPYPPPILPKAFHIGIWTNVRAGADTDFSHPGTLLWENFCDNWVWNFFGYDQHPDLLDPEFYTESCFQFNQLLSEDEWFYQEPDEPNTIYWLSIAAIYDPNVYEDPYFHPWGWKTRPWYFEDDAVRIMSALHPDGTLWPTALKIGSTWQAGNPVFWPDLEHSWDLTFELTTVMPDPDPNDDEPPGPGPIDWDIPPSGAAPTVITMTARTLTDENGVEYYFDEMTGNAGGDDSGWQDSSGYTDSGLDPNTTYEYRVKARDKSPNKNETTWSPTGTATTPLPYLVDYNVDKIVNFKDFAYFANKWLTSGP